MDTFYRRVLPEGTIPFGSADGRKLLVESLSAGTSEAFYPLISHLHTQAEPAWCGLGSLVTVLNALEIDPGRVWKGPWRYFGEELLICCKSLELAASEGLSLSDVACLAACNGAHVEFEFARPGTEETFREVLSRSLREVTGPFVVANYSRRVLGQTGEGHFSPLAAVHSERDLVLVLDVARFKYPPHWVGISRLFEAMSEMDPQTQDPRGWLAIGPARKPSARPPGVKRLLARLEQLGVPRCPMVPAEDPAPG